MRFFGIVKPDGEIWILKDTPLRRRLGRVPEISSGGTVKLCGGLYHYDRSKSFHTWGLKRTLFLRSRVFTEFALWRQGTSAPLDLTPDSKSSLFSAEVISGAVESAHIRDLTKTSMNWKDILLVLFGIVSVGLVIYMVISKARGG